MTIYSYLPLDNLLKQISCISKKERELLVSDSELLNQNRCLRISFCPNIAINYSQLKYCMLLATSYEIYVEKMQEIEVMPFQMILHKITKINNKLTQQGKSPKEVQWLTLGLNYKINMQLMHSILVKQKQMFENLMIKIIVPTSSELMPKLFSCMNFVKNMEIDLNNKTIDFYEFPSYAVQNIKKLSFKKHSFNFEKLVELFEQIEELKIRSEEFMNTKQSLIR